MSVLLVAVAGSGCLGADVATDEPPTDDTGNGAAEVPSSIPWTLSTCRVVVALIPVDAEAVEAHLPEGFTAVSGTDAFGLPPDFRGEAVIGLETFDCASGQGLNGTVDGLAYGAYFTAVTPPDAHAVPDADVALYKWDTLIPDAPRRAFLQERGLPAVDGATDLTGQQVTPGGHAFDVTVTLGGDTHRFTGFAGKPADAFREGFYFVEFTDTPHGMAAWHMRENEAPDAVEGSGTVELAAGSLPADIVGAESSQAFFASATTVQFIDGTLELP